MSTALDQWLSTYGELPERGGRNWGIRYLTAELNDVFIVKNIAPELDRLGIQYSYELSHSGTCYLHANDVKIRLSDHEIDHVNYDMQILWPSEGDVTDIINYILHEEMREEINNNNK